MRSINLVARRTGCEPHGHVCRQAEGFLFAKKSDLRRASASHARPMHAFKDGSNYIVDDYYKGYKWLEPLGLRSVAMSGLISSFGTPLELLGKTPRKMPESWPGGTTATQNAWVRLLGSLDGCALSQGYQITGIGNRHCRPTVRFYGCKRGGACFSCVLHCFMRRKSILKLGAIQVNKK